MQRRGAMIKISMWLAQCGAALWDPAFAASSALWLAYKILHEFVPGLFVVLSVTLFTLVLGWPVALVATWDSITGLATDWTSRAIITGLCGVVGLLLYITKRTMQTAYGISEVFVGLAACWGAVGRRPQSGLEGAIAAAVTLGGGLYIIVRGLSNCGEAKEKKANAKAEAEEKNKQWAAAQERVSAALFWRNLTSPYGITPENPIQRL